MHLVRHRLLNPFQAITPTSQVICWDKKWMYFVQRIETAGALARPECRAHGFRESRRHRRADP
jgi:hypothetical protein